MRRAGHDRFLRNVLVAAGSFRVCVCGDPNDLAALAMRGAGAPAARRADRVTQVLAGAARDVHRVIAGRLEHPPRFTAWEFAANVELVGLANRDAHTRTVPHGEGRRNLHLPTGQLLVTAPRPLTLATAQSGA